MIFNNGSERYVVYKLGETMEQIKCEVCFLCWENNSRNFTKAARALDITVKTLKTYLQFYKSMNGETDE